MKELTLELRLIKNTVHTVTDMISSHFGAGGRGAKCVGIELVYFSLLFSFGGQRRC